MGYTERLFTVAHKTKHAIQRNLSQAKSKTNNIEITQPKKKF